MHRIAAPPLLAFVALATACGGSDNASPTPTPEPTPAASSLTNPELDIRDRVRADYGADAEAVVIRTVAGRAHFILQRAGLEGFRVNFENRTCPPLSRCPYMGESPNAPGHLVIAYSPPVDQLSVPTAVPGYIFVYVNWYSDDGGHSSAGPQVLLTEAD